MNKFGKVFSVNSMLDIEIKRFVPKNGLDKGEIEIAVWSPGRRRNYTRVATRVRDKVYKFKFEGHDIEFEMI